MHVVLLSDYAHALGGAERVAIDSAVGLRAAGCDVHLLAGVGPADPVLAAAGVHLHLLDTQALRNKSVGALLTSGLWSGAAATALRALLAGLPHESTIVHAHSWQRALTTSVLATARRARSALIVTLHEYGLACPNQGFFDYQAQAICERRALGADCLTTHCDTRTYAHKLWRSTRVALQRGAAGVPGGLRHVITLSTLSRRVLEPYFGPDTVWHDVRNPVGVERSAPAAPASNKSFLFVGRVSREKGADLFAQAAHAAAVQGCVAGDGPELAGLRARFPALRYTGWVPAGELPALMRQARALVFPSIWYETLGLTVQEALAVGLPVIVADRTAARESVVPGRNGLLFAHQDVADLARCLAQLAGDDAQVAALGRNAYDDYWRDPPTPQAHVQALLRAYERCLADRRETDAD